MLRTLAFIGALLGGSWLLATTASGWRDMRPAERVASKPLAPIEVTLAGPDGRPLGSERGRVAVHFSVTPRRPLTDLAWRWELPPEVVLLEGGSAGDAAVERAATTEGDVVLLVPDDGRYHRAELVVRGAFEALDADGQVGFEPIAVAATLTWGRPGAPLGVVLGRDPATGQLEPRAVLPAAHRPAGAEGR